MTGNDKTYALQHISMRFQGSITYSDIFFKCSNPINYLLKVAKISIFYYNIMASSLKVAKCKTFFCNAIFSFLKVAKIDQIKTNDQRFKAVL